MTEPIRMAFGMWTWMSPMKHVLGGGAQWCHLANTIEPSVCGGDTASCQITLTTCAFRLQTLCCIIRCPVSLNAILIIIMA